MTGHGGSPESITRKTVVCHVYWVSPVVYYLTSRRVLVGYSTLVLAQREPD